MDTCKVPGPAWIWLFNRKLFKPLQPLVMEIDPPPSPQFPSAGGTVPCTHP